MIEMNKENEYEIYDKTINIDLFNKIIAFIDSTNTSKIESNVYDVIAKKCIWNKICNGTDIKEKYKFEYLGELLERYEERIGTNIRDIRAIALALGYATNFVDDNMIIGTQLIDFINRIKSIASNDIYLKAALYLFDNQKFYMYGEELLNKVYRNTEEIIFAMSIFYERIEDFFKKNRQQIIDLLGKNKNMSAIGNVRVYAWLIKNLYSLIKEDRKKDIALLRALIKLPTGFQNENSSVYKDMANNNYSKEEIAYLNYLLLYYRPVPKSVKSYSLVEEKIATNLCEILINSKKTHSENLYELIRMILEKYSNYEIKCYGYTGINQLLENRANIVNPITFVKLYDDLGKNLYSFNILNEKWNILANIMDDDKYQELFDKFLLESNYNKKELNECIIKYNMLTNKNYIDSFLKYDYRRSLIFELLIDKGVFLLKDIYEKSLDISLENGNKYLKGYIGGINNKKSFEFLKYILRLNKYNIKEIDSIGFDFDELTKRRGYYYEGDYIYLNIQRSFMKLKDYKILLDCLEKFIFYNKPEIYFKFLKSALNNDIVCKIYKKDDLRKIYFLLCEVDPITYKQDEYQKRYLNKEEIDIIVNQRKLEEELKEKRKMQETEEYINSKFLKIENKNNFKSLYDFCSESNYLEEKMIVSANLVKKYIMENMKYFSRDINETANFIILLKWLIDNKKLTSIEFENMMSKYIELGVENNEHIDTTYEINN